LSHEPTPARDPSEPIRQFSRAATTPLAGNPLGFTIARRFKSAFLLDAADRINKEEAIMTHRLPLDLSFARRCTA